MLRSFENYQRQLWPVLGALARRGYVAQPADANDIIHDFFVDEWPLLQEHYDSSRGPFEHYLYGAFYRYARRRIARFHSQRSRLVEIDSALSVATDDIPAEEMIEADDRAAEMREALARLPEVDRLVLGNYLSDASDNERDMARHLGITRYRLRESITDAVGRLATHLNSLKPQEAVDRKVAVALWRDGKDVGEVSAELGVSVPQIHVIRKRIVRHLLHALQDSSARKTSRRETMSNSKRNPPTDPLDLLKATLLSKGDAGLLAQVQAHAQEILSALDAEDQKFSAAEQKEIDSHPEWLSSVYAVLGSDDADSTTDVEARVEASIASVLANEDREIGEAFAVLVDTVPDQFHHWSSWFRDVPHVPTNIRVALEAKWLRYRAGPYTQALIEYGITPATIFEATMGISLLLDRCSTGETRGGHRQFVLMLESGEAMPEIPGAQTLDQDTLMAQILASADCPPKAAAPLLNWLFALAAYRLYLFEGYRVEVSRSRWLYMVDDPLQSPVELMHRWSDRTLHLVDMERAAG